MRRVPLSGPLRRPVLAHVLFCSSEQQGKVFVRCGGSVACVFILYNSWNMKFWYLWFLISVSWKFISSWYKKLSYSWSEGVLPLCDFKIITRCWIHEFCFRSYYNGVKTATGSGRVSKFKLWSSFSRLTFDIVFWMRHFVPILLLWMCPCIRWNFNPSVIVWINQ